MVVSAERKKLCMGSFDCALCVSLMPRRLKKTMPNSPQQRETDESQGERDSFNKCIERSGSKSRQRTCIHGSFHVNTVIIKTKALLWRPYGKLNLSLLSRMKQSTISLLLEGVLHPPCKVVRRREILRKVIM